MRARAGNVGFNSTSIIRGGGLKDIFVSANVLPNEIHMRPAGQVLLLYIIVTQSVPGGCPVKQPCTRELSCGKKRSEGKKQNQQLRFSENLTSRFGRSIIPGPILTRIDRAGHQHWLRHLMDDCHAACGVTILGPFLPSLRTSARDPCHSKVGVVVLVTG